MKLILIFWICLLATGSNATYEVLQWHCNATSCEDMEFRGGTWQQKDCDPSYMPPCQEQPGVGFHRIVCYNELTDFVPDAVLLFAYPSGTEGCPRSAPSQYIIRTGLCEKKWRFSRTDTNVTVAMYDDWACAGTPTEFTYDFSTCYADSHYGVPARFELVDPAEYDTSVGGKTASPKEADVAPVETKGEDE